MDHVFEWHVVECRYENEHHKDMCVARNWMTCSKYTNHSRLNSQHDRGDYVTTQ
jgi:hypothetical protein